MPGWESLSQRCGVVIDVIGCQDRSQRCRVETSIIGHQDGSRRHTDAELRWSSLRKALRESKIVRCEAKIDARMEIKDAKPRRSSCHHRMPQLAIRTGVGGRAKGSRESDVCY